MTPEDKAKQLVQEMKGGCCMCPHDSKNAAIVCCDEIIRTYVSEFNSDKIYWQQVKKEIEKL